MYEPINNIHYWNGNYFAQIPALFLLSTYIETQTKGLNMKIPFYKNGLFIFLSTLCLILSSSIGGAEPICSEIFNKINSTNTNSTKFMSLETETPERYLWILEQNRKLNLKLKKSPNKNSIEKWLKELYGQSRSLTKILSDGSKIKIYNDNNLSSSDELILEKSQGDSIPLFSSSMLSRNQKFHIIDLSVSPDEKYVAFVLARIGSLDKFNIGIYDLKKKELLKDSHWIETNQKEIYWLNNHIYAESPNGFRKYDLSQPEKDPEISNWYISDQNKKILLGVKKSEYSLITPDGEFPLPKTIKHDNITSNSLVGQTKDFLYLKINLGDNNTEIRQIPLPLRLENTFGATFARFPNSVIKSAEIKGEYLFVVDSFGARQSMSVFDQKALQIAHFDIPVGTSISEVIMSDDKQNLNVTLRSNIVESKDFTFDLKSQKFTLTREEILSKMLTVNGQIYESNIVDTLSEDGTLIPMRITKLKNLPLNGSNPVFMKVYAGFGIENGFYPIYNPLIADFLSRGGILVDPALRGGNEFGDQWHLDATKEKKINTFKDLIATSRYLVSKKYTQPQKIIITGTSNGGLTVAGTALQSPKDFGLVIPVNGVQDLLHKETLDANFYRGWAYEYGDSTKPNDYPYLSAISPVERVKDIKDLPQFFILNGRQDSRVNPAHSYKLYAALNEKFPENVQMSSINNSGHWNGSVNYQGMIGWRANVIIWTLIYDYLGWQR